MTSIDDCKKLTLPIFTNSTGSLIPFELNRFSFRRVFWVTDIRHGTKRGNHAHHFCNHFMICLAGNITVSVDDGYNTREILLDQPNFGLFVPAMIWDFETFYNDAVLLVFATEHYSDADYIRDYAEFKRLKRGE